MNDPNFNYTTNSQTALTSEDGSQRIDQPIRDLSSTNRIEYRFEHNEHKRQKLSASLIDENFQNDSNKCIGNNDFISSIPGSENKMDSLADEESTTYTSHAATDHKAPSTSNEPSKLMATFDSFFDSDSSKNEMVVNNLIISSDYFLHKAHELVLDANSIQGGNNYFRMIKISIKALLILIKKYNKCLSPRLESIVYFKIAKIYFIETENLNRADDYVNKAIAIAARNNLIKIKFISEFLAAQILEKSNSKISLKYLNEKITNFKSMGFHNLSNLFSLLKIDNLFLSEPTLGLTILQSLCQDPHMDNVTKSFCLLYQSNLHLYRGSPNHALELTDNAEISLVNSKVEYPIQLKAMLYLQKFAIFCQINNVNESKKLMKTIGEFILFQQNNNWKYWKEDGTFTVEITIPSNNESDCKLSYKVSWLNSDEFVIMFYFLLGVSLLSESYNLKNKSKKVFQKCLQILEKQLLELRRERNSKRDFPLHQLTNKILKLNYIKYYINYYQVWMNFLNNDFSHIKPLNEFLDRYNNKNFLNDELSCYRLLIPKIFYLFAIYFQYKSDLRVARYWFLKVHNLTSNKTRDKNSRNGDSILQMSLGIGGESYKAENEFSELFVYATLHLAILAEYEVNQFKNYPQNNNEYTASMNEICRFRGIMYKHLTEIFTQKVKKTSNSFNMNFTKSIPILSISYNLLLGIYGNYSETPNITSNNKENSSVVNIVADAINNPNLAPTFPYVTSLVYYFIYSTSDNLALKDLSFDNCLKSVSMEYGSDNERIVNCFILREYRRQLRQKGEYDQAALIETQLQYLEGKLQSKFSLMQTLNPLHRT